MAKINENGLTIADKSTGKHSAKSGGRMLDNLFNIATANMDKTSANNANAIKNITTLITSLFG